MNDPEEIVKNACEVLRIEGAAVLELAEKLDDSFARMVQLIHSSKGRVILTGVGKSAIIAQKISATLNSTGTPSGYLHAADAIHGDLGMVMPGDILLFLSKSGNTPEIKVLAPLVKALGNQILAMISDSGSYLEQQADMVIKIQFNREAGPDNLVPTTSTTLQLAVGDALAISLLRLRGETAADFGRYHPGGTIGKRLYLRVSDLYVHNERPLVDESDPIQKVIIEISSKRLGATAVSGSGGRITGIITDGDLRRMMEKHPDTGNLAASGVMSLSPKCISPDETAVRALEIMRSNSITQLLVIRDDDYLGIIHIHDILREGII
jgi:arabinose-5-phosphate isomerase